VIRASSEADVAAVQNFVADCPPLTVHTEFTYWVLLRYWGDYCLIAEQDDEITGVLLAIGAGSADDLIYLWQVGVTPALRGTGLAQGMLCEFAARASRSGRTRVQVSVADDNRASHGLFARFAEEQGDELREIVKGDEPTYELLLA
jgi:L-2,4-diaminobutyric acid acetyltransferase